MTIRRWTVGLVMAAMTVAFASGCTMTFSETGRPLSVGPAANHDSHREKPPQPFTPMSRGLGEDDRTAAGR